MTALSKSAMGWTNSDGKDDESELGVEAISGSGSCVPNYLVMIEPNTSFKFLFRLALPLGAEIFLNVFVYFILLFSLS